MKYLVIVITCFMLLSVSALSVSAQSKSEESDGGSEYEYIPYIKDRPIYKRAVVKSVPMPAYPERAKKNRIEGTVLLRVVLTARGEVSMITPIQSPPDDLTEAAIESARGIKFEPAQRNGDPISMYYYVFYNFSPSHGVKATPRATL